MSEQEVEKEYPKSGEGRGGVQEGWSVEVRYNHNSPKRLGEHFILDQRWKRLPINYPTEKGIAMGGILHDEAKRFGLVSYQAAQALTLLEAPIETAVRMLIDEGLGVQIAVGGGDD